MTVSRLPVILVLLALFVGTPWHQGVQADQKECETHGTSVFFAESIADAARYAMDEEKLLFVLHVSGHFEESDYT